MYKTEGKSVSVRTMKMHVKVEIQFHSFLTSALGKDES